VFESFKSDGEGCTGFYTPGFVKLVNLPVLNVNTNAHCIGVEQSRSAASVDSICQFHVH